MSNHPLFAWYSTLPTGLLRCAYDDGYGELAWARPDALAVVRFVQERGYDVFSIEPWLPTRPGPTPLIDDWDQQSNRGMSAEDFINTFHWTPIEPEDAGLEVVFAIDIEQRV